MEQLLSNVNKLRRRVCQYRLHQRSETISPHVNAVDIVLSLVDYAVRDRRPIAVEEEHWFKAGMYLVYTFENSEWEDIATEFENIVDTTEQMQFFRDKKSS